MAEWDYPRSMLRRIRGVGYTVVAPGQLNINPRNVPGSIPGAGRVWQFPSLFFCIFSLPTVSCHSGDHRAKYLANQMYDFERKHFLGSRRKFTMIKNGADSYRAFNAVCHSFNLEAFDYIKGIHRLDPKTEWSLSSLRTVGHSDSPGGRDIGQLRTRT